MSGRAARILGDAVDQVLLDVVDALAAGDTLRLDRHGYKITIEDDGTATVLNATLSRFGARFDHVELWEGVQQARIARMVGVAWPRPDGPRCGVWGAAERLRPLTDRGVPLPELGRAVVELDLELSDAEAATVAMVLGVAGHWERPALAVPERSAPHVWDRHEIELYVDYAMSYPGRVADDVHSEAPAPDRWLRVGTDPGGLATVLHGTPSGQVPYTVEVLADRPCNPDASWQHAVDVSLPGSGPVRFRGWGGPVVLEVPWSDDAPGVRARFCWRGLAEGSFTDVESGSEEVLVQLWAAGPGLDRLVRLHCPPFSSRRAS